MAACTITDPVACVSDAIGSAIGGAGEAMLNSWAEAMVASASWVVENLTTMWLDAPSPDLGSSTSPLIWLQDKLSFVVAGVMVASVLMACYRIGATARAAHLRGMGEAMWRTVYVSTAGVTIIVLGIQIGDAFSDWILDEADLKLSETLVFQPGTAPGLMLILGLVVLVAQLLQFILMMIRNAMLILLAATLPVAAAGSNTDMGKQTWLKAVAWTTAFVLYKPTAAVIYAFSFRLASADQPISSQLTGVAMMLMALVALPALMRFVVPMTAAMSGGNAGAMAVGVTGAALATGAVVVTGGAAGLAGGGAAAGAAGGGGGAAAATGGGAAPATGAAAAGGSAAPPNAGGSKWRDAADAIGAAKTTTDSGREAATGAVGDEGR